MFPYRHPPSRIIEHKAGIPQLCSSFSLAVCLTHDMHICQCFNIIISQLTGTKPWLQGSLPKRLKLLHIKIHLFWFGVQLIFFFLLIFLCHYHCPKYYSYVFIFSYFFGREEIFFSQLEYHK